MTKSNTEIRPVLIGVFAGVFFAGIPMGLVIQHKERQVSALADFANQILTKTASAMEVCVASRDAAILRARTANAVGTDGVAGSEPK